jgi:hypothetical protein
MKRKWFFLPETIVAYMKGNFLLFVSKCMKIIYKNRTLFALC